MSEPQDSSKQDLELDALQRQLEDAFNTTRPRVGFEDELWTRMQAARPAGRRLLDAWLGLIQVIREAPRVPVAAVAAVLVVIIGVTVVAQSGLHFGGGASSTAGLTSGGQPYAAGSSGGFGRLPSPVLNAGTPTKAQDGASQPSATAPGSVYAGPVALNWAGKLDLSIATAPVFRYREPTTNSADQFATSLGAILQNRPAGYLGSYETTDFNVRVRGTVQVPAREPSFIILPITPVAPIEAAGGPVDVAVVFLAQHSLAPSWQYTSDTTVSGNVATVTLSRQFAVSGYGYAYLVDSGGERHGMQVDLSGSKPISAEGPLPLTLESADYPIISADEAVRAVLASSPANAGSATTPTVALTTAELVYSLVVAGDHSFYEPSILFTGTFKVNGTVFVKHVLVPAVDPSQRSS